MGNDPPITQQSIDLKNADTAANKSNTESVNNNVSAVNGQASAFANVNDIHTKQISILTGVQNHTISVSDAVKTLGANVANSAVAIAGFNNLLLGAGTALSGILNIDTTPINTFSDQIKGLQAILEKSPAASIASKGIEALRGVLMRTGVAGKSMSDIMGASSQVIIQMGLAAAQNAENQQIMIESMIKAGARSGDLQKVMMGNGKAVLGFGKDMMTLKDVLETQQEAAKRVADETGVGLELSIKYAAQLREMPGGFEALAKAGSAAAGTTNELSSAIRLARASGRDYSEIMADVKTATTEYNLKLNDAIKFSARMTEVSKNLQIPVSMIHSAMQASAAAFSLYANSQEAAEKTTDGLSKQINNLAGALRNSGVNMKDALGLAQNYTAQIGKMDLAQKAFLSAQTGGPGGLMGAFDIQDMLDEGDIAGVFKKVKDQMEGQLGSMVSVKEAKESPEAAMQLTRQIQMLKQGPLGQFAKTDTEAIKMLESMQKGKAPAELGEDAQQATNKILADGNTLQQQSHTELVNLLNDFKNRQLKTGLDTLKVIQDRFTGKSIAPGGTDNKGAGIDVKAQQAIQTGRMGASNPDAMVRQSAIDKLLDMRGSLPKDISDKLGKFTSTLTTGTKTDNRQISQMDADLRKDIANFVSGASGSDISPQERADTAKQTTELLNKLVANTGHATAQSRQPTFAPVTADTPARQVGRAVTARTAAATANTAGGGNAPTAQFGGPLQQNNNGPVPVTFADGSIKIELTGKCPHCDRQLSEHTKATAQAVG